MTQIFGPNRHTAVPHRKDGGPPENTIAKYQLTDVELAYVRAGRYDMIQTAEQRGVIPEIVPPRELKKPKEEKPKTKPGVGMTKKFLEERLKEGKTNVEIAKEYGCAESTVHNYIKRYGLHSNGKTYNKFTG